MIPVLAIGTAWLLLASAIATVPHRAKLTPTPPPPPTPPPTLDEQFDAIVAGDWFNGALHYTGRSHGGAA
jgi:hypothetical protein